MPKPTPDRHAGWSGSDHCRRRCHRPPDGPSLRL